MRVPQPGEQFGRFRIDRIVGQGGMGVVYAATDTRLDRTVALKVITGPLADNEEFLRRFHDEASVLARLDSPYVVQIIDHDELEDIPYIVTQYVDGTDLASYLRDHGPLPASTALTLCAQVARGLGDAHRRGVIHRDIKPGNVLVRAIDTSDMHAYVCDFGIARSAEGDGHTATGMVAGTWAYLAPERTQGAPASPASDLYALGCLLWACLTGAPPYSGTEVQVALAHSQAPVPQLPGTDEFTTDLNHVLTGLLAKDPADRYPDAAAARREIELAAVDAPERPMAVGAPGDDTVARTPARTAVRAATTLPRPSSLEPTAGSGKGRLVAVVAAVLLIAGGGAIAAVALGDDDSEGDDDQRADPPAESVAGDVTGDGYGDLLLIQNREGGGDTQALWTFPSNGSQFGTAEESAPADSTLTPRLADVDGDGRLDRVAAYLDSYDGTMQVEVTPGDGSDAWETELSVDPGLVPASSYEYFADLDDDGRDDLLSYGGDDTSTVVFVALAEDHGFGKPTQWYAANGAAAYDLLPGDFDGDGDHELMEIWPNESVEDGVQVSRVRTLTPDGSELVAGPESTIRGNAFGASDWLVVDVDGEGSDEVVIPGARAKLISTFDVEHGVVGEPTTVKMGLPRRGDLTQIVFRYGSGHWATSDLDGDDAGDLIYVGEPGRDDLSVTAYLSEDGTFGAPREWGSLLCGNYCSDYYEIVAG